MSGSRQLFSQAPIQQAAPMIPVQPGGSALAAAMSQPHPMALQTPSMGIPLSTMMELAKAMPGNQPPLTGSPNGQPSMGANLTPDQMAQQVASNQQIGAQGSPSQPLAPVAPTQGPAPGTPSGAAPGMPSPGSPGIFGQAGNWLQGMLGGGGQYPPVAGTG